MKDILVKTVMIPLSNYVTVKADNTLYDVFQILEKNKAAGNHAHRDAMVVDDNGDFKGKVTMLDIFKTLEPNYNNVFKNYEDGVLTKDFVMNAVRDFNLWLEPMHSLCERGAGIKVSEIMNTPEEYEYLQEDDSLEKALHEYVIGVHQPLIVKNGDKVTGILRFGDLFEVVRDQMLSCPLPK
ncbi:MAG: CBS domain-containing protein [Proteobacteria bacterium]|nr:CBS domain-containing protein [Pseudomonadota bacterium]MBU1584987.1 CBS domain-containing protein [Pseudomonadota bacterium]MBU2631651.1 CBS domain-containing protein [Pseudomonadota bacterium]